MKSGWGGGWGQISYAHDKGQRTRKIVLVHFHEVPHCVTPSKASEQPA